MNAHQKFLNDPDAYENDDSIEKFAPQEEEPLTPEQQIRREQLRL